MPPFAFLLFSVFSLQCLVEASWYEDKSSTGSSSRDFYYSIDLVSNSDPFELTVSNTACADFCQVGDSIVVHGNLIISQEFTDTVCATLDMYVQFGGATSQVSSSGQGSFCDTFEVVSVDGTAECPSPGTYTFSVPLTVTSLSQGLRMQVVEELFDCDGTENISIQVDATIWSVYSAVMYSSVGLVALAGAILYRRRRQRRRVQTTSTTTNNSSTDDDDNLASRFEMMTDPMHSDSSSHQAGVV